MSGSECFYGETVRVPRGGDTVTEGHQGELSQGQCLRGDVDNFFPSGAASGGGG